MRSGNGRHRRPRQAPALLVTAGVAGAGLALPLLGAASAHAADAGTWDKVADCESGGLWSANQNNGYYGGLQLTLDMWKDHGGTEFAERPDLASRGQQIEVAERILDDQGPRAWPSCAADGGLTQDATQAPDAGSGDGSGDGDALLPLPEGPDPDSSDSLLGGGDEADGDSATPSPSASSPSGSASTSDGPSASPTDTPSATPTPTDDTGDQATSPAPSDHSGHSENSDGTGRHRGAPAGHERAGHHQEGRGQEGHGHEGHDRGRHRAAHDERGGDAAGEHRVAPGETLSGIAAEHHVDGGWHALYERNRDVVGADPDLILPGQHLKL